MGGGAALEAVVRVLDWRRGLVPGAGVAAPRRQLDQPGWQRRQLRARRQGGALPCLLFVLFLFLFIYLFIFIIIILFLFLIFFLRCICPLLLPFLFSLVLSLFFFFFFTVSLSLSPYFLIVWVDSRPTRGPELLEVSPLIPLDGRARVACGSEAGGPAA